MDSLGIFTVPKSMDDQFDQFAANLDDESVVSLSHMLHVWYIYLHFGDFQGKCAKRSIPGAYGYDGPCRCAWVHGQTKKNDQIMFPG